MHESVLLCLVPWYSRLLASPERVDWVVGLARAAEVILASRASHLDYHPMVVPGCILSPRESQQLSIGASSGGGGAQGRTKDK